MAQPKFGVDKATDEQIEWCVEKMWEIIKDQVPEGKTAKAFAQGLRKPSFFFWQCMLGQERVAFALVDQENKINHLLYLCALVPGHRYGEQLLSQILEATPNLTVGCQPDFDPHIFRLYFKFLPKKIGLVLANGVPPVPSIFFLYSKDNLDFPSHVDSEVSCGSRTCKSFLELREEAIKTSEHSPDSPKISLEPLVRCFRRSKLNSGSCKLPTDGEIERLLRGAGATKCSVYVQRKDETLRNVHYSFDQEKDLYAKTEESLVFSIGSLTKDLVALLMFLIVEVLSRSAEEKNQKFRAFREKFQDPWATPFATLFNYYCEGEMAPIPKNPTLRLLLHHCNGFPTMNHTILSPEGKSLMSKEGFHQFASTQANMPHRSKEDFSVEYSNINHILIGLLIEGISKTSLENVLKDCLFDPLSMSGTSLGVPASANSVGYPADCLVSPAFGGRSTSEDIAKILNELLASLKGERTLFDPSLISKIFQPLVSFGDGFGSAITLFGFQTNFRSSIPGARSFNSHILPETVRSKYRLGQRKGSKSIEAYYSAGTVGDSFSTLYFLPKQKSFVIVLSSGSRTDASDFISKLFLQRMFELERSRWDRVLLALKEEMDHLPEAVVDIFHMSSLAAKEMKRMQDNIARADAEDNVPNLRPIQLEGKYSSKYTHTIIITKQDENYLAIISGTRDSCSMGLIRTGDLTFRLQSLGQQFSVERYDHYSWKNMSFELTETRGDDGILRISSLKRHLDSFEDVFTRVDAER